MAATIVAVACGGGNDGGGSTSSSSSGSSGLLPDGAVPNDASALPDGFAPADAGPIVAPQPLSVNIVVDQFGYRAAAEKIAVLRSPVNGFDKGTAFAPGARYAVVDAHTGAKLLEAAPSAWNGGAVDSSSGDKAWWLDFSSVTTPGDYFVLDETANVRSDVFRISDDVYRDVLAQAVRMLYYQRDGIAKDAKYAGADWADGPAHMGPNQDPTCTLYQGATKKDVHGGWFDAGDQNKYTNWGASDVVVLLRAYTENPGAFFDDYGIPESGNGVADVLDETKWEIDWLVRMQNDDGSALSIVGQDGAKDPTQGGSPNTAPSTATGPCTFGPATTSATLSSAAAFAHAAIVFKKAPGADAAYPGFVADLTSRAAKAWTWADANPSVTFQNAGKVGAGEQETDAAGRQRKKLMAAVFLYELTGDTKYRDFFDQSYATVALVAGGTVDVFAVEDQDTLLEYTTIPGATASVASNIKAKYKAGLASGNNLGAVNAKKDPYLADVEAYTWGSNQIKADQGNLLYDTVVFGIDAASNADAARGAERYAHYVHGVNPLQLVYLSNMGGHGAAKSVTRFYHSWFAKGSDWDAVGVSKHAPPPGYLVGGPNPSYAWDGCCPSGCSGKSCGAAPLSPPTGQPDQKAYADINDSWPIDSWSVSEPDDGYQAKYIRLLSKFVK
jgi:endoglucanase